MKTVEKVAEALKAEGFLPTLEEFGITFKFQMTTLLFLKSEDDEEFFNLVVPYIYDVTEENELDVLRACNEVNNSMKVVKLVVNRENVWVCFENELNKDATMDEVIEMLRFAIPTVYQARQNFYNALKEQ